MTEEFEQDPHTTWAMFCHLGVLSMFIIPFGNYLAPLVLWLAKRGASPLVDDQGKESLNFQISMTIWSILSVVFFIAPGVLLLLGRNSTSLPTDAVGISAIVWAGIGVVLVLILGLEAIIFPIIAAVKTSNGTAYRYPTTIRLIK